MIRPLRRRRSTLYVPASNARAMAKTTTLACDAVIFDLEDAVAPDAKVESRHLLVEHFAQAVPVVGRERIIRVNAENGVPHAEDIEAAARCRPDAVLLPKLEKVGTLLAARQALDSSGGASIRLWAMIETPLGIVNLRDLAEASAPDAVGLDCLVAGVNDLAKEANLLLPAGRPTIVHWLALIVIHARAFGMDVLDGVFNELSDVAGFAEECKRAAAAGFDGKTLIHPGQIGIANDAFSPSQEALEEAQAIVAAFEGPENSGRGVAVVNGKMTERLHADMARRLIARSGREATIARLASGHD